jgi:hypothetical protein
MTGFKAYQLVDIAFQLLGRNLFGDLFYAGILLNDLLGRSRKRASKLNGRKKKQGSSWSLARRPGAGVLT